MAGEACGPPDSLPPIKHGVDGRLGWYESDDGRQVDGHRPALIRGWPRCGSWRASTCDDMVLNHRGAENCTNVDVGLVLVSARTAVHCILVHCTLLESRSRNGVGYGFRLCKSSDPDFSPTIAS